MLKSVAKWVLKKTPYRVSRGASNRFQAIEEALRHLHSAGFRTRVIVDGGAHVGDFSCLAHRIFPDATIHMVEPQPACLPILQRLASSTGFKLHAAALGSTVTTVRLFVGDDGPSTGCSIALDGDPAGRTIEVPTTTLDDVLSAVDESDRAFIKLDLQGYEPEALKGGLSALGKVEVVLTEVAFFGEGWGASAVPLVGFFDRHGFELFDVASLGSRGRDGRLKEGDLVFVRRGSPLLSDIRWS